MPLYSFGLSKGQKARISQEKLSGYLRAYPFAQGSQSPKNTFEGLLPPAFQHPPNVFTLASLLLASLNVMPTPVMLNLSSLTLSSFKMMTTPMMTHLSSRPLSSNEMMTTPVMTSLVETAAARHRSS
jgi:hypothetical protein